MQLGKYQLIRELATGGMAEVFLARTAGPMGFEKQLVLKRILPHMAKEPAFVEMFLSEATLAARLTHPGIVQIFDFGEAEGSYFLAMEYIDGPSLRALLERAWQRQVPLPPAVCARIIANACEGLAFAHDFRDSATGEPLDIVHRDISPDNLLLSRQGTVKVADFGVAKAAGQRHRTRTGIIKGKLAYMPPEQVRAQPLDRRVDVYALGVVLYELVTGQRPFDAPTDASLMQSILFEPPMPAVLRQPDLPEPVQRILRRALAKDPDQRYPDCLAFQGELEEFILSTGKPVTALHVAQLIAQLCPPEHDAPLPALPPGSPPLENTALSVRPSEVPPAKRASSVAPLHTLPPEPQPARAQQEDAPALAVAAAPPASLAPAPAAIRGTRKPYVAVALASTVLLAAGGGYLLLRGGPPAPPAAPRTELASAPTQPPPAPEPPAAPVNAQARAQAADSPAAPEPAPAPPAPPPRPGFIDFDIKPRSVVFIEGQRLGETPLGRVQIDPGTYNLRFVSRRPKKEALMRVEVKPDAVVFVKVDLLSETGMPDRHPR